MKHFLNCSITKLACLFNSFLHLLHILVVRIDPFWLELSYFMFLSIIGFVALKVSNTKTASCRPKDLDIFFTSVSAVTVSSMSTVEMEVFSTTQFIILTILMLIGGEVFFSLLGLQLTKLKIIEHQRRENKVDSFVTDSESSKPTNVLDQLELGTVTMPQSEDEKPDSREESGKKSLRILELSCTNLLASLVLCYLLLAHLLGSLSIYIYTRVVQRAREVLEGKGLNLLTFSAFTTVSSFANCGFVPTNENMMVFKKNSGLLLILILQILMGNTLYPICLRFIIWISQKLTKRAEFKYMLKNSSAVGYSHLMSGLHSTFLAITVLGFLGIQFILFCTLEWHSEAMRDLSSFEKLVASLFEVVNSRHAGESVFDLSMLTPAFLVLFTVMMYLPPYASFLPIKDDDETVSRTAEKIRKEGKNILDQILFSQLIHLAIFVFLICITEREKMKEDPLNFNLLSTVFEVISAYGNVGYSMGYSCERQIKKSGNCKDALYGFAGRWSNQGKFILIVVMFCGKLKKFIKNGGKAWIL